MTYDAVVFDFDGTLVEGPQKQRLREAVCQTCRRVGIEAGVDEVASALRAGNIRTIVERCRAAGICIDSLRRRVTAAVVRTQVMAAKAGARSVYDGVQTVTSIDMPTGIVSDNHPAVLDALLKWFGIAEQFDVVRGCRFTRDGLDRRKPSSVNLTGAMTELDAASALYVGDRPVDVAAAKNAGIDSALLVRDGSQRENTAPTHVLSSLTELPEILATSP